MLAKTRRTIRVKQRTHKLELECTVGAVFIFLGHEAYHNRGILDPRSHTLVNVGLNTTVCGNTTSQPDSQAIIVHRTSCL
eukprot:COSAG05_NODE_7_length_42457_cov_58.929152_30_plen_80_part_00